VGGLEEAADSVGDLVVVVMDLEARADAIKGGEASGE